jgi:hypothetical protein
MRRNFWVRAAIVRGPLDQPRGGGDDHLDVPVREGTH